MTEQDKVDFGITKENLHHFIENNKVKVEAILEDYKRHLLKSGEYIPRSQAFFVGLLDNMKALVEEEVDKEEFTTFLDQECHQIEDALKNAWEEWKEEQSEESEEPDDSCNTMPDPNSQEGRY